jgi:hypothetical protein
MWPTAVLASALVRPVTVPTNVAPIDGTVPTKEAHGGNGGDGGGKGGGGEGEGGGGEGGGWACCSSRRWLGTLGVGGGTQTGGGGGMDGRGMGGYGDGGGDGGGDEDRGGGGPESGGYRDGVGGAINWGGEGGQGGKGGSRGPRVDGKRDRGNKGAATGLLPAEEGLVRMGTPPAWACCARW